MYDIPVSSRRVTDPVSTELGRVWARSGQCAMRGSRPVYTSLSLGSLSVSVLELRPVHVPSGSPSSLVCTLVWNSLCTLALLVALCSTLCMSCVHLRAAGSLHSRCVCMFVYAACVCSSLVASWLVHDACRVYASCMYTRVCGGGCVST